MFNIHLEKRAVSYIASCPLKHQDQLKSKILSLQGNPYPTDSQHLKGFKPYLRLDQGEYRIIYKVEENKIFVILVGKRNDSEVYKTFKRLF